MAETDKRPLPTQIPQPDYERIRAGDRVVLEGVIRTIVDTVNAYILRKGG